MRTMTGNSGRATVGNAAGATAGTAPSGPRFDVAVPASGYRWWYVDGLSGDGDYGIVVIAFIGSVFSPYYYRARARGPVDPTDYCAVNVGIYGRRGKLWTMTERGKAAVSRDCDYFAVGPSELRWRQDRLEIRVRERAVPFGQRLAGTILVEPAFLNPRSFRLDAGGRHLWHPLAPSATVSVVMQHPGLRWRGDGYFDTNFGGRALEEDFSDWNWSRCHGGERTRILYNVNEHSRPERSIALEFDADGAVEKIAVPPAASLPRTGWRVARPVRLAGRPRVLRTLEDTPFYARSVLAAGEGADAAPIMHESLSLMRFRSAWVRMLLPFRMPRNSRWSRQRA